MIPGVLISSIHGESWALVFHSDYSLQAKDLGKTKGPNQEPATACTTAPPGRPPPLTLKRQSKSEQQGHTGLGGEVPGRNQISSDC